MLRSPTDEGSAKEGPAAPSALPISDKPVTLSFSKGPIKLSAGEFISYNASIQVELNFGTGPVKPTLLSMDDGSDHALPEAPGEPPANPSKGTSSMGLRKNFAKMNETAHQVKKVAPLIASKKVGFSL